MYTTTSLIASHVFIIAPLHTCPDDMAQIFTFREGQRRGDSFTPPQLPVSSTTTPHYPKAAGTAFVILYPRPFRRFAGPTRVVLHGVSDWRVFGVGRVEVTTN
jgi:hypothetical protein